MQNPDLPHESFLEQIRDTSERTGVHLPCINANHLFQILTGPGRTGTRNGGK